MQTETVHPEMQIKLATDAGVQLAYSADQVCQILGISLSTFYRRCRQGEIQTLKLGHRTLVARKTLLILTGQAEPETAPAPARAPATNHSRRSPADLRADRAQVRAQRSARALSQAARA